eukprot:2040608-Alexandrium_andersonii.AAC.1
MQNALEARGPVAGLQSVAVVRAARVHLLGPAAITHAWGRAVADSSCQGKGRSVDSRGARENLRRGHCADS